MFLEKQGIKDLISKLLKDNQIVLITMAILTTKESLKLTRILTTLRFDFLTDLCNKVVNLVSFLEIFIESMESNKAFT